MRFTIRWGIPMEHDQATRLRAAERYLLGELSDVERYEFEKHFFTCRACTEDVQAGAIFEANARAVFAEQPHWSSAKPGWWEWVCLRPAFAASLACLLVLQVGGLSYVAVESRGLRRELAELRAPQSYPSVALKGVTRGAEQVAAQVIEVPRESQFFGLSLDLSPEQSFGQYRGDIVSESGATLFSVPLSKPRTPGDSVNLLIPVSSLKPGRYTLIVRGLEQGPTGRPGIEIATYDFVIQRK